MEINSNFWNGKKVLITGHTGFKGSWISLWLQSLGASTGGFSLPPDSDPNLFTLAEVGQGMKNYFGDIRNLKQLSDAIRDFKPEIVIHMAAQAIVRRSYINPIDTFSTNVIGVVNLFEAIRVEPNVKAVVNVTTDKCYENIETLNGYKETDRLGGHDPYSSSKACSELVTSAYRRSFFYERCAKNKWVAIATARAGNVIGGGDWSEDRLAPDIIRSIQNKNKIILRNPNAVRPWQHVLDPLCGYLLLAESLYNDGEKFCEAWNFGPDNSLSQSVGDLVTGIFKSLGRSDLSWTQDRRLNPHEARYLTLDCQKAKEKLGYHQILDFQDMINYLVEWHMAVDSGVNPRDVTIKQIRRFEKLMSKKRGVMSDS